MIRMSLAELLTKVEIRDINVRFYTILYIGSGETSESVKFMTRDYDITSIPKSTII